MSLPPVLTRRWRWSLTRLLANGLAQAAVGFTMAHLLRLGIAELRHARSAMPTAIGILALGLLRVGLRVAEVTDAERLGQDYVTRVRLRLFRRVTAADRGVGTDRVGVTLSRLIGDLSALRGWVAVGVARAGVASATLAGTLVALAHFGGEAVAIGCATLLFCVTGAALLTPRVRSRIREARRRRGRLANNLGEKVVAAATIRHFGRSRQELRRVRTHSLRLRDALVRRARASGELRAIPEIALPLSAGLLLAVGALGTGSDGGGSAAAILMLLGMISASMRDLSRSWIQRLSFEEGRRRIEQLLAGPRMKEVPDARDLPGRGPLPLRLVGVGVDGVLEGIHLEAEAGERILLTGPSGSGKSLLLRLIARLLDPSHGELLLDDIPLRQLSLDSVLEAVQLVAPELPLLRGTVGENIAYGAVATDPEWVERVVEACALGSEDLLPEGLETRVEEQGRNLPGGVRARVALARAVATRPRILAVDDSCFSADPTSARALRQVLALCDATTLVVASPVSGLLDPDRVWILGGGSGRQELPGQPRLEGIPGGRRVARSVP